MDFMNSFASETSYPEVILCKFGEIILKGANRQNFESALVKELRRRASPLGVFKIYFKQSTVYVEPQNDECDMDGMYESVMRVFGCVLTSSIKAFSASRLRSFSSIRRAPPRSAAYFAFSY